MRVVYRADSLIDAHLVRGRLESEGIPAWVMGEHLTGGMGELPVGGLLQVCVAEVDLPAAAAHMARWHPGDGADDAGEEGFQPLLA